MVDLYSPDTYVPGPPHEAFEELRRTQPVYWQDMPDGTGYWAVLKHADVVHVAREPVLFSASEGGVVLEDLDPERLAMMRNMLLAMDPPRHVDYRRPLAPSFKAKVIAGLEDRIRAICREIMARGGREARRRLRARGVRAPAVAGGRRAHGPPPRRLAEDPPLGRDEHQRAGRRARPARRRLLQPRRRHDRDGDVRDRVRGAAPHRAGARGPHVAHPRQRVRRRAHDRHRLRQLLRAARHRRQRHHQDDAVVGPARAAPAPRPARGAARRPVAHARRGRGDPALGQPAALLPAHRHRRHRAPRRRRSPRDRRWR